MSCNAASITPQSSKSGIGRKHTERLVHCAGGYRSAAAASIIEAAKPGVAVYDLGEAVTEFVGAKE